MASAMKTIIVAHAQIDAQGVYTDTNGTLAFKKRIEAQGFYTVIYGTCGLPPISDVLDSYNPTAAILVHSYDWNVNNCQAIAC